MLKWGTVSTTSHIDCCFLYINCLKIYQEGVPLMRLHRCRLCSLKYIDILRNFEAIKQLNGKI